MCEKGFQKAHSLCAAKVTDEAFHLSAFRPQPAQREMFPFTKVACHPGTDKHYLLETE